MNNQLEFAQGGNPSLSDSELYLPQSSTTSNSFIYIYKKLDTAYAEAYGITYNLKQLKILNFLIGQQITLLLKLQLDSEVMSMLLIPFRQ